MTTEKQLSANQKNALKSTGPASASGKLIVSKNAIKDAILTKEVFIDEDMKTDFLALKESWNTFYWIALSAVPGGWLC